MCKELRELNSDMVELNRIQKEEFRNWIEAGYGCFRIGDEMIESKYIHEGIGVLDGQVEDDSWVCRFGDRYEIVSYM